MNKLKLNIPVEITLSEDNNLKLNFDNETIFNEIILNEKNYSQYIKFIVESMFNRFNNSSECDCKRNIQDLMSKNISDLNEKEKILENKYTFEIEKQKQTIELLKQEQESKINNLERKYEVELENKTKQYFVLEESINDKICSKFGEKEKQYLISLEKKESEIDMLKYKIEQTNINNQSKEIIASELTTIKSDIQKFFKSDKNDLGAQGENFIYEYLRQYLLLTDASIEKVNGLSNACDIYLSYGKLKCGIESKNHTGPVRSDHINRFITTDIHNPQYNCGIFISIKSEFVNISGIKHFDIKFYNNKPVIFLSEILKKPEQMMLAIKTLEFIISHNSRNENEIQTIIQAVQNYIPSLEALQRNNKQITKIAKESDKNIDAIIKSIYKLLAIDNPNVNSNKKEKHKCEKCNQEFEKKVELNRHNKECKVVGDIKEEIIEML